MNIIDSKSDLGFKKVFAERPHLLMSLLNNLLPLSHPIASLEYLSPELTPDQEDGKNTIVDVRCTDTHGRHFIVEMQIEWTDSFKQRLLFEAGQALVKQLKTGEHYHLLQPVYGLGLIAAKFDPTPKERPTMANADEPIPNINTTAPTKASSSSARPASRS